MGRAHDQPRDSVDEAASGAPEESPEAPSRAPDAVWFSHRADLLRASSLLRSLSALSASEREELCLTMERVGYDIGLLGPWRVFDTSEGVRLSYIRWWDDSAGESAFCCHEIQKDFDGRLIDGLPEPRYLGRLVQKLASELAGEPWHDTGPEFSLDSPS